MFTVLGIVSVLLVMFFTTGRGRIVWHENPAGWLGSLIGLWIGGLTYNHISHLLTYPLSSVLYPLAVAIVLGLCFTWASGHGRPQ